MITGSKEALEARCRERGYSIDEIMPCVVSQDGDTWTVDETHWAYPARARPNSPATIPPDIGGPGTELKELLRFLGFTASPTCSCNARARAMDENEYMEPGWCEANMDAILGWLQEQAEVRGLPFVRTAAKILVNRAIATAKRKSAQKGNSK